MRFGVHVRTSGGYAAAIDYAKRINAQALQVFSSNPRSYRTAPINKAALANFKHLRQEAGLDPCVIHTPYLINLATDDPKIAQGSLGLLKSDLASANAGGMRYVNTHLGSYGGRDRREGFLAACRLLESALADIGPEVYLVLENSAGSGSLCGGTLEELGTFCKALDHPQLGVCLDTAHAWAAGYEINSQSGVDAFIELADRHIGLERVHIFHFNDTQIPLGGNRDRHWHIGEGNIGFEGFRALALRSELSGKTAILETPGEEADDLRNMETIAGIFRGARGAAVT